MKQYFLGSLFILFLLMVQVWRTWPDQQAHLIFCDVGQGDATLITSGSTQILIDGGRHRQAVLACLAEHVPFWDRTLELMIATHADADHIGGLSAVLAHYHVSQIIANNYGKETDVFAQLKTALAAEVEAGAILKNPILGQQMVFSQEKTQKKRLMNQIFLFKSKKSGFLQILPPTPPAIQLTILSPQVDIESRLVKRSSNPETTLSDVNWFFNQNLPSSMSHNDLSIALFLQLGALDGLLMADLEQVGELSLLRAGLLDSTQLLKVGHHGAKTSTSHEFVEVTRPEISVISVGKNNNYGHPSPQVLSLLSEFDSQIKRTDQLGTIELVANEADWRMVK